MYIQAINYAYTVMCSMPMRQYYVSVYAITRLKRVNSFRMKTKYL